MWQAMNKIDLTSNFFLPRMLMHDFISLFHVTLCVYLPQPDFEVKEVPVHTYTPPPIPQSSHRDIPQASGQETPRVICAVWKNYSTLQIQCRTYPASEGEKKKEVWHINHQKNSTGADVLLVSTRPRLQGPKLQLNILSVTTHPTCRFLPASPVDF